MQPYVTPKVYLLDPSGQGYEEFDPLLNFIGTISEYFVLLEPSQFGDLETEDVNVLKLFDDWQVSTFKSKVWYDRESPNDYKLHLIRLCDETKQLLAQIWRNIYFKGNSNFRNHCFFDDQYRLTVSVGSTFEICHLYLYSEEWDKLFLDQFKGELLNDSQDFMNIEMKHIELLSDIVKKKSRVRENCAGDR